MVCVFVGDGYDVSWFNLNFYMSCVDNGIFVFQF